MNSRMSLLADSSQNVIARPIIRVSKEKDDCIANMEVSMWLILLVLPQLLCATDVAAVDSEEDLRPYLRGFGWRRVEEELRKDLRLNTTVRPISYDINLHASVRGYGGAERSTFDGTVQIVLNTSSTVTEIELHSAELIVSSSSVAINEIRFNRERETVIFTLPETLQPTNSAQLKIYYNGTAVMRGIGLYESWTKREDNTSLPTVSLVTNCSPTGARRWFPSFDDPDKKATFRLTLTHPTKLVAYSNTEGVTKTNDSGLSETKFDQTPILPTYVFAFALTEQPVVEVEHNGQKIRAIGWKADVKIDILNKALDQVKSQPAFQNVTFIPQKTDWLIVEDFPFSAMENPGLITFRKYDEDEFDIHVHELAHMYFGNLVTPRSWEQIWLKEGFASFFQLEFIPEWRNSRKFKNVLDSVSYFEPALHSNFSYVRTPFITGHFFANGRIHYSKAPQLISLIKRFIGEKVFDEALNRYLIDNSFGNGDSGMMINYISENNTYANQILKDWVYQPGIALLSVEEQEGRVIIEQRRYLRTDFIEDMRDTKTRWTIPIYYTINGEQNMTVFRKGDETLIVDVPVNSNFSIDESYTLLYAVHYKNRTDDHLSPIIKESIIRSQETYEISISDTVDLCEVNANKTTEELWEMYLIKDNWEYLICDIFRKTREQAKTFLHNLLVSNDLAVRNKDLDTITQVINQLHPGILLEFLTEENANIDYLNGYVAGVIENDVLREEGGLQKLQNIVLTNPSFAANFYYMFTKIFEQAFIMREEQKRIWPVKPNTSNTYSQMCMFILVVITMVV